MAKSTHDYRPDPRNDEALISIDGELIARPEAKVSVFDSGFMLGDGVWESMRIEQVKAPLAENAEEGLCLFTVHVRRGRPDVQDPKLNSHSKLNCILACIQQHYRQLVAAQIAAAGVA